MIGYHRVILHPDSDTKGNVSVWSQLVKQGRPLDMDPYLSDFETGAHTFGHNGDAVGICVIGNKDYSLHPLQLTAIQQTAAILVARFRLNWKDVHCHRDFNKTECPGNEIASVIQRLKDG